MKKVILLFPFFLLYTVLVAAAVQQSPSAAPAVDSLYVFRFVAGNNMFYIPWQGNDGQLRALCRVVDAHRAALEAGNLPVYVDSYCASLPTVKENLTTAFVRANRVKSELITRKGLTEADFVTANYARAYSGIHKDVVVVTLRLPAASVILSEAKNLKPQDDTTVIRGDSVILKAKEFKPQTDTTVILSNAKDLKPRSTEQEMLRSAQHDREKEQHDREKGQQDKGKSAGQETSRSAQPDGENITEGNPPYRFALRTNLLYDALLLPALGVEWRVNDRWGIRLDGSLSRWNGSTGKVQKIWLLNPELRWYLLNDRRFYVGASGSYGEYNIYKYPLGSLLKDDTGYQGKLWNAGVTVGYQLYLSRHFSVDFNLGLGYTRSEYDSFTVTDGTRVIRRHDRTKNLWGPTQAGITLVWTIGSDK